MRHCTGSAHGTAVHACALAMKKPRTGRGFFQFPNRGAAYLIPPALRSSSALSIFSHEKAVAFCDLPAPSV